MVETDNFPLRSLRVIKVIMFIFGNWRGNPKVNPVLKNMLLGWLILKVSARYFLYQVQTPLTYTTTSTPPFMLFGIIINYYINTTWKYLCCSKFRHELLTYLRWDSGWMWFHSIQGVNWFFLICPICGQTSVSVFLSLTTRLQFGWSPEDVEEFIKIVTFAKKHIFSYKHRVHISCIFTDKLTS